MNTASDPRHLSRALADLIAQRGLARVRGTAQLTKDWNESAGAAAAAQTKVLGIKRGVLQVAVTNSALLGELASFHKTELIDKMQKRCPDLRINDIKFRLNGRIANRG